jgi:large subunit ribosomal protein L29
MATKRTTELKAMDLDALQNEQNELSEELSKMKFDHAVKGIQDPLSIRKMRREIAKVNTELRARQVAELTPEQHAKRSKIRERRR